MARSMFDLTVAQLDRQLEPRKRPLESKPILFWACGVGEEAGEVLGVIKKLEHRGDEGMPDANDRLLKEAGDVLFYLRQVLHKRGLTLEDAAEAELKKLEEHTVGGR